MDRDMIKGGNDPASFGAEALPSGFKEICRTLHGVPRPAVPDVHMKARAPLIGLIALAEHWLNKRGRGRGY